MDYARDHDEHHHPHRGADHERVDPLEGGLPLLFVVKSPEAHDEDDDVEDEGHVHVDVNHAADHFAPTDAEAPLVIGVIVNPERHGEEEDKVGEDEVENSYGGDGRGAGLHDVHHQAEADGPAEQNHAVDDQEGCAVLIGKR